MAIRVGLLPVDSLRRRPVWCCRASRAFLAIAEAILCPCPLCIVLFPPKNVSPLTVRTDRRSLLGRVSPTAVEFKVTGTCYRQAFVDCVRERSNSKVGDRRNCYSKTCFAFFKSAILAYRTPARAFIGFVCEDALGDFVIPAFNDT